MGIIKAEVHEGFLIENNKIGSSLRLLSDLIFTPQNKLYKIGLFIHRTGLLSPPISHEDILCFLYDTNATKQSNNPAHYFYQDFLGLCRINDSAAKTSDFYSKVEEFFQGNFGDPIQAFNLRTALRTYLFIEKSSQINVNEFSSRYLPKHLQDHFNKYMKMNGFDGGSIEKDLSTLQKKIKRRRMYFSNQVNLTIDDADASNAVQVLSSENNETRLCINGILLTDD